MRNSELFLMVCFVIVSIITLWLWIGISNGVPIQYPLAGNGLQIIYIIYLAHKNCI